MKLGEWQFDNSQVRVFHHFFNPSLQHSRLPSNAYAHLLAQISFATQKQLPIPDTEEESHAVLTDFFRDLSIPEGERWVIVLDGLDDAAGEVLSFLPDELPEGLFVVVSGRWDGEGELPSYLKEWAKFAEFIPLHALDESELREWLQKWGDGELAEFAEDEGFVKVLMEKTDGLPIFVRYLLEDLGEAVEQGGDVREVLGKTPEGFNGYINEQLDRLGESIGDKEGVRKLFALMTVAKGVMRRKEVEDITGLSAWDFGALPMVVTRWLSVGEEDGEETFAFAHPLLAEGFRRALGSEAEGMEESLLDWCLGWRGHRSPYALRFLFSHLKDKGRYEDLFELARDKGFERTQREVLPYEPDLPRRSVEFALKTAIESERAEVMAEMLLRHAKVVESEETPVKAMEVHGLERAIGLAKQRMEMDYKVGTLWFLLLSWWSQVKGNDEGSVRCLEEIVKWWRGRNLEKLDTWQSEMAMFLLLHLVEKEFALEVARLVLGDESKVELSVNMAKAGKLKEAKEVAEGIESEWKLSDALQKIAEEIAKSGEFDGAIKVAEGIEVARKRSEALREIATEMVKAGEFEKAIEFAEGIGEAWKRSEALMCIATEMAKLGEFERAIKVAEGIEYESNLSGALKGIATEMARAGMIERAREVFEKAIKVAEKIRGTEALKEIATEMAKAGMVERAREALEKAWMASQQTELLSSLWDVAEISASLGFFDLAVEFAQSISVERIKGLPKVMDALKEQGAKGAILRLLPLCGWSMVTAVKGCACLVRLYPGKANIIGEQVRRMVAV